MNDSPDEQSPIEDFLNAMNSWENELYPITGDVFHSVAINPHTPPFLAGIARQYSAACLIAEKLMDRALPIVEADLNPPHPDAIIRALAFHNHAQVLFRKGAHLEAVESYLNCANTVGGWKKTRQQSLLNASWILSERLDNNETAREVCTQGLSVWPEYQPLRGNLIAHLTKLGLPKDAIAECYILLKRADRDDYIKRFILDEIPNLLSAGATVKEIEDLRNEATAKAATVTNKSKFNDFKNRLDSIKDKLSANKLKDANAEFDQMFAYPGHPIIPDRWPMIFRVAKEVLGKGESEAFAKATLDEGNPRAFFDLGYALIEEGRPLLAATVLKTGCTLHTTYPKLLEELISALEMIGASHEIPEILESHGAYTTSYLLRYLYALHSILGGNIAAARDNPGALSAPQNENDRTQHNRIRQMLERHRSIGSDTDITEDALREREYVVSANILLHISPHGFESMKGRYAAVSDFPSLVAIGIKSLLLCFRELNENPSRVLYANTRGSKLVAKALSSTMKIRSEPWIPNAKQPGILALYSLEELSREEINALRYRPTGQLAWVHLLNWTKYTPFTPEFITLLYQFVTPLWQRRAVVPGKGYEIHTFSDDEILRDCISSVEDSSTLLDSAALSALCSKIRGKWPLLEREVHW